jgi:hypothetical protein
LRFRHCPEFGSRIGWRYWLASCVGSSRIARCNVCSVDTLFAQFWCVYDSPAVAKVGQYNSRLLRTAVIYVGYCARPVGLSTHKLTATLI